MKAEKFNLGWFVKEGVADPFAAIFSPSGAGGEPVVLPQDAMILEKRDENCQSKAQSGFYPAKSYTYTKEFEALEEWREKVTMIEFEGVMMHAHVFLNGKHLATHEYGYSNFYVDLTPYLNYGEKNVLKVVSVNKEKASRWYPGSGIYRDVTLWQGGRQYIPEETIRVRTETVEDGCAVLAMEYDVANTEYKEVKRKAIVTIYDGEGKQVRRAEQFLIVEPGGKAENFCRLTVPEPELWSVDTPSLYEAEVVLFDGEEELDAARDSFGIRTLSLSAASGLKINGETVKLRGACIHHDNGVIGATTLEAAEEFRLKALKNAGFNSIRCAHNPASKAMLRACDRIGMLVMDELTDMWNEQKNANDFSLQFGKVWEEEVKNLVDKDYNHPSVVMYSTGNEIPEIGRSTGADMNRKLARAFREADHTRYVTCCISGFLAVVDCMGAFAPSTQPTGQPQEEEKQEAGRQEKQEQVAGQPQARVSEGGTEERRARSGEGSEELNSMMGATQQQMMDAFSVSPVLDECIEPVESELDVIGYNYLTARHEYEHLRHPDRVVVGSETYPPEIPRLWEIVKKNPHVIGDFTWTGFDYLGEAGIGIFHYDADQEGMGWFPDRLAYQGDIDINGNRRDISYFREIVFGLRKAPYIAVERADKVGHVHDENNWKFKDAVHSWTFPGYEGTVTRVYVFSGQEEVELFLNGKSMGKKKVGETEPFTAVYEVPYEAGHLCVKAYENGAAVWEDALSTAGEICSFCVETSKEELAAGGGDAAFITVDLADEEGNRNMFGDRDVTVSVDGAGTLLGFASARPSGGGGYQDTTSMTYDGRIMAAIRSAEYPGEIRVRFTAEGCGEKTVLLHTV